MSNFEAIFFFENHVTVVGAYKNIGNTTEYRLLTRQNLLLQDFHKKWAEFSPIILYILKCVINVSAMDVYLHSMIYITSWLDLTFQLAQSISVFMFWSF